MKQRGRQTPCFEEGPPCQCSWSKWFHRLLLLRQPQPVEGVEEKGSYDFSQNQVKWWVLPLQNRSPCIQDVAAPTLRKVIISLKEIHKNTKMSPKPWWEGQEFLSSSLGWGGLGRQIFHTLYLKWCFCQHFATLKHCNSLQTVSYSHCFAPLWFKCDCMPWASFCRVRPCFIFVCTSTISQ